MAAPRAPTSTIRPIRVTGEQLPADGGDPGRRRRLVAWNVDSIRARLELVLEWIDDNDPDVICLQETKVGARSFPRADFQRLDFELACTDGSGYGGVAIASRIGLDDVIVGFPGARVPLNEQRSVSATCDGLRLHSVYAPNGRKVGTRHHEIKLAWFGLLAAWVGIDGLEADQPTVILGDLNVAPTDLDVWDPSRYRKRNLTSPAERAAFARLLERGLIDVVREYLGDEPAYSWWNRRGDFFESDRGWRLDHCLTDPATAARVTSVSIDHKARARIGASDHAPVVVDLVPGNGD